MGAELGVGSQTTHTQELKSEIRVISPQPQFLFKGYVVWIWNETLFQRKRFTVRFVKSLYDTTKKEVIISALNLNENSENLTVNLQNI